MKLERMFLSLIPWIAYGLVLGAVGAKGAGWAATAALVAAVVLLVVNGRGSSPKILDVAGVATFVVLALAGFTGGPAVREFIDDYGRGGVALVLCLVMTVSCFTVPYTEQYAREFVPREHWHSPVFRALNRRISAIWAAIVFVMAICHLVDGAIRAGGDGHSTLVLDLTLNWVVPVALVLGGINLTKRTVAGRARAPQEASA